MPNARYSATSEFDMPGRIRYFRYPSYTTLLYMDYSYSEFVRIIVSGAMCAATAKVWGWRRGTQSSGSFALFELALWTIILAGGIASQLVWVDAVTLCAALLVSGLVGYVSAPNHRSVRFEAMVRSSNEYAGALCTVAELLSQEDMYAQARHALTKRNLDLFAHAITELADVNLSQGGYPPLLHEASALGSNKFVDCLLAAGADPNWIDHWRGQITALHLAARSGDEATVTALLRAGASVDTQDQWGCTPLQYAAAHHRGHTSVVELLLNYNADPTVVDRNGRTPLDWATNSEVVSILHAAVRRR